LIDEVTKVPAKIIHLNIDPFVLTFPMDDESKCVLLDNFGHHDSMYKKAKELGYDIFQKRDIASIATKDLVFTIGGFESIFSHVYLDYLTSWKMRPFYPFSTDTSITGAVYFFDPLFPLLNLFPLLPIFIMTMGNLKKRGRLKGELNSLRISISGKEDKLYALLIFVLLFWMILLQVSKVFLISHVSGVEDAEIDYQNTYPESMDKFITAYSWNSTYYQVFEISYLSGIKESEYVEKTSVTGKGVIKEIDYPVYSVSEEKGSVTVTLSDARNSYFEDWAYFKSFYNFIFDMKSQEFLKE
jgi:inner membrane protein